MCDCLEIGRLENLLNKKAMFKAENLSDEHIEILKLLVHSEESPIKYIATRLKMSEQKIKYFLDKLEEDQLVSHTFASYDVGKAYSLNENGRKFLFEKELL